MDYSTILTAIAASVATGIVSTLATVVSLRVHITYLRADGLVMGRRMTSAEKRLGRAEISVAELQTKAKGI